MFRNLTPLLPLAVISLALGCSQAEFKEFSPPGGGFKVLIPGTPREQTLPKAETQVKFYIVEERQGTYSVGFADIPLPGNETAARIQSRLDDTRVSQLREFGAKLVNESQIQLAGKYPGRDFRADLPNKDEAMRWRIFVVDKRLYLLIIQGAKSWVNSAETDKFFNSFALAAP